MTITGTPYYRTEGESIVSVMTGLVRRALHNNGGQLLDPHCYEADEASLKHLIGRAERWLEEQREVSAMTFYRKLLRITDAQDRVSNLVRAGIVHSREHDTAVATRNDAISSALMDYKALEHLVEELRAKQREVR